MIRALHNALDLRLVYDDVRIFFPVRIAGMKDKLFVLRIEAELLQIVFPIKESDNRIALIF